MTFGLADCCEIRIPTYRRPQLLRRALLSILQQTYSDWRCIVFDDCPDGSARSVAIDINDRRIEHVQNHQPLGAIGNIDRSFTSRSLGGGKYAFVLEDDNYLLPKHIEMSINRLEKHGVKVALCNQFCEQVDVPGELGRVTNETTLNWMYKEGLFSPNELLPALLFSQGFSNGAAFWRTDCLSDFEIGGATKRPGIQESLRLLRLRDQVYVSLLPTAVWRCNDPRESSVNTEHFSFGLWKSMKLRFSQLSEGKEKLAYRSEAVKRVGLAQVLEYAKTNGKNHVAQIERALLLCGYNVTLTKRRRVDRLQLLLIGRVAMGIFPTQLDLEVSKLRKEPR